MEMEVQLEQKMPLLGHVKGVARGTAVSAIFWREKEMGEQVGRSRQVVMCKSIMNRLGYIDSHIDR